MVNIALDFWHGKNSAIPADTRLHMQNGNGAHGHVYRSQQNHEVLRDCFICMCWEIPAKLQLE